jgi:hypothetical protein
MFNLKLWRVGVTTVLRSPCVAEVQLTVNNTKILTVAQQCVYDKLVTSYYNTHFI